MKLKTLIGLAAVAGIGYLLYRSVSSVKDTLGKATDAASAAIASIWLKLFPLPPQIELLGNVKFPGNLFVPIEQLMKAGAVRSSPEPNFAVYVNYAGYVWKLQPQVYGNWPAVRVGATP